MSESQHRNTSPKKFFSKPGPSSDAPDTRRRRRPQKKGGILRKIVIAILIILGVMVGGAVLGSVFGMLSGAGLLNTSDILPNAYNSVIYDAEGEQVDMLHGTENREYVKIQGITKNLQDAVVAIEDERFYEHGGIDIRGIGRALIENVKTMSFSQGASTITQQVIKNEVLTSEKKLIRKIKEQYLAITLESKLRVQLGSKEAAKQYILELYLNTISLHHGLRGVESAAQYYFGRHANDLTLAESACIAGITKNPSLYAPDANPEKSRERQLTVLKKMKELGYITEDEYEQAVNEDVFSHLVCRDASEGGNAKHNYFVEAAVDQIAEDLIAKKGFTKAQAYDMIYSGGLKIHTTMDSDMQDIMEDAMTNDSLFPPSDGSLDVTYLISVMDTEDPNEETNQQHYEKKATVYSESEADAFVESVKEELLDDTHVMTLDKMTISRSLQAAMVIMDQENGEVKALVGGRGEKPGDSVFNRATQALRQQGSAMKPLAAYAPAIDQGLLMPGSIIVDEPVHYGNWSPENWDKKYIGPTTVRQGIWHSMNVLAVKTFMMVGADTAFDYLLNFGFTTLDEEHDKAGTTALGGLYNGVSVLEGTAAYAAIANGGTYNEPVYYTEIYDHEGKLLLDTKDAESHRVIKETTAFLLTDMMKDVITKGTGKKAGISGMTVAGKTGTTNDDKDLTFYGYTPYYTAGIWMGYDTAKAIKADSNHLKIWRTVMSRVHRAKGLSDKDFHRPKGLVHTTYCSASGGTPTRLCAQDYYGSGVVSDWATKDFKGAKRGPCTLHQSYTVCAITGMLPGPNCPTMNVVLAVEGGRIVGKPSEPSGKLDIRLDATCNSNHTLIPNEEAVEEEPLDPNAPLDPNQDMTEPDAELPEGETPGGEGEDWKDDNFGIQ